MGRSADETGGFARSRRCLRRRVVLGNARLVLSRASAERRHPRSGRLRAPHRSLHRSALIGNVVLFRVDAECVASASRLVSSGLYRRCPPRQQPAASLDRDLSAAERYDRSRVDALDSWASADRCLIQGDASSLVGKMTSRLRGLHGPLTQRRRGVHEGHPRSCSVSRRATLSERFAAAGLHNGNGSLNVQPATLVHFVWPGGLLSREGKWSGGGAKGHVIGACSFQRAGPRRAGRGSRAAGAKRGADHISFASAIRAWPSSIRFCPACPLWSRGHANRAVSLTAARSGTPEKGALHRSAHAAQRQDAGRGDRRRRTVPLPLTRLVGHRNHASTTRARLHGQVLRTALHAVLTLTTAPRLCAWLLREPGACAPPTTVSCRQEAARAIEAAGGCRVGQRRRLHRAAHYRHDRRSLSAVTPRKHPS